MSVPASAIPSATSRLWTAFLFLVVVFGFGSAFMLNSIAVAAYPPLLVAFIRALVAMLAVASFALWRGHRWAMDGRSLLSYLAVGAFTTALPFAAIAYGQLRIPSSLGGVLFATIPLFTLSFGPVFFRGKRIGGVQLIGAIVGLAGVAVATRVSSNGADWQGVAVTLLAALSYALGGLLAQRFAHMSAPALASAQLACGTVLLALVSGTQTFALPDLHQTIVLVLLGTLCTAAPMLAVFALIRRVGAPAASTATLFIPVVAVSIGVVVLGERFSAALLAGLVGVMLGAHLIVRK